MAREEGGVKHEAFYGTLDPTNSCPCCGHPIGGERVFVDLETNTIGFRHYRWNAAPQLAEFVYVLAARAPRAASYLLIGQSLWGPLAPEGTELMQRCSTYACWARAMLRRAGVTLESVRGRGYRLITRSADTQAAAEKVALSASTLALPPGRLRALGRSAARPARPEDPRRSRSRS